MVSVPLRGFNNVNLETFKSNILIPIGFRPLTGFQ